MKRLFLVILTLIFFAPLGAMEEVQAESGIWKAAQNGNVAALNVYISHGQSPFVRNSKGETLLMVAAANGREEMVEQLIQYHCADVNEKDFKGYTALSLAVRRGHFQVVKQLLRHSACIDSRNAENLTPLHSACMGGHLEIASLLLDYCADVNAVDSHRGRTPLLWVVRMTMGAPKKFAPQIPVERSVQLIKLLLERGADPTRVDFKGKTALDWAIAKKMGPLVAALSNEKKSEPRYSYVQPARLYMAEGSGYVRSDSDKYGYGTTCPQDIPKPLMEEDINQSSSWWSVVANRIYEVVAPLIPPFLVTRDSIWRAAARGDVATLRMYVEYGHNVDELNEDRETPLIIAVKNGRLTAGEYLMKRGANLEVQDTKGRTALFEAIVAGNLQFVHLLLYYGASSNYFARGGISPLNAAILRGETEMVRLLLDYGAKIDMQDSIIGRSVLHWAVMLGMQGKEFCPILFQKSIRIMRMLLERGANPMLKDRHGQTALDWAKSDQLQPLILLLERAMQEREPRVCCVPVTQPKALAPKAENKLSRSQKKVAAAQARNEAEKKKAIHMIEAAKPIKAIQQVTKPTPPKVAKQSKVSPAKAQKRKAQSERAKAKNKAKKEAEATRKAQSERHEAINKLKEEALAVQKAKEQAAKLEAARRKVQSERDKAIDRAQKKAEAAKNAPKKEAEAAKKAQQQAAAPKPEKHPGKPSDKGKEEADE